MGMASCCDHCHWPAPWHRHWWRSRASHARCSLGGSACDGSNPGRDRFRVAGQRFLRNQDVKDQMPTPTECPCCVAGLPEHPKKRECPHCRLQFADGWKGIAQHLRSDDIKHPWTYEEFWNSLCDQHRFAEDFVMAD
jgi:hypothetical protein